MIEEHKRCAEAINQTLCGGATPDQLQNLPDVLLGHFAHEEALMLRYNFGEAEGKRRQLAKLATTASSDVSYKRDLTSPDSSFSTLTSHINDHKRIADMARKELAHVASGIESIHDTVAQNIAYAFAEHYNRFDVLYVGHIPASAV